MGLPLEEIIDERLHEQDVGEWAGLRGEVVFRGEVLRSIETLGKGFRPPGGESMTDVGRRMARWLEDLTDGADGPNVVLAFTHGGAIRSLASYLGGWSHSRTYGTRPPNVSISVATRREGGARVHYVGWDICAFQAVGGS
jgi:broad specificity phosphatase PhoE